MEDTIIKVLEEVACPNTGACQINLQSASAREMIANKVAEAIRIDIQNAIEDIVLPVSEQRH
jgi:hypothetical protein